MTLAGWWIWSKHEAIFRKDKFTTELDWAEAYFEGDDERIDSYLEISDKYRGELEKELLNQPLATTILNQEIVNKIEQIIKIFPI